MVDKDLEDFLKSSTLREAAKKVKQENHLSLDELRAAVYEDPELCKGTDYDKIQKHLEECKLCEELIKREREINPIYKLYKEAVPNKMSEEEFWDYIGKIQEEVNKEKK